MTDPRIAEAIELIEKTRKQRGLSVRQVSERTPKISETYWRQLVNGGVTQSGVWVPKLATIEQIQKMAAAVGADRGVAELLGTEPLAPTVISVDVRQVDTALDAARHLEAALVALRQQGQEVSRDDFTIGNPASSME